VSEHKATVTWRHTSGDFAQGRYSREHTWTFDGGVTVPASSSPTAVRVPFSNPAHVDPEEAFVAAIASCHMLSFLYVAMKAGFEVVSYEDEAIGTMTKNEAGVFWVSAVVLQPKIVYAQRVPSAEELSRLHHAAHEQCFIANSVRTNITVEGRIATTGG
jgi:organic hydroperoxide reductase OsmC/OhrA